MTWIDVRNRDGANPEVIRELKRRIGEYQDYHRLTEEQIWAFRRWQLADNTSELPEETSGDVAVDVYADVEKGSSRYTHHCRKLIVSLRTAVVSDEWNLDKQQTSHHDILDSFMLACCNYELPKA